MLSKIIHGRIAIIILIAYALAGCINIQSETPIVSEPIISETAPISPTPSKASPVTPGGPSPAPDLSAYAFPDSIDPEKQYLFYLHGKIIEDQGIPAISPEYGEYEYQAILEKLAGYGFVVIAEQRPRNANGEKYARKVAGQITTLFEAGVPPQNITVVGASKGAAIAIHVSYFLENEGTNFVILGDCHPDVIAELKLGQVSLFGNVLSIYDSVDEYSGSCQELFSFSEGKGLARHAEIVLNVGTGHGILYKPLDEWIIPSIQWAGNP
ncbi:MAG: alpha/beta hydrolase [Anaerolineales bacterium]|nr:alpha/beta hydrolase [Anaerolineales bacterium]